MRLPRVVERPAVAACDRDQVVVRVADADRGSGRPAPWRRHTRRSATLAACSCEIAHAHIMVN